MKENFKNNYTNDSKSHNASKFPTEQVSSFREAGKMETDWPGQNFLFHPPKLPLHVTLSHAGSYIHNMMLSFFVVSCIAELTVLKIFTQFLTT